ncbi:CbiX/SirB N-terminal domain-containing protein [Alcanivorax sp.]|uniref:sirohydrochlorin chelatase n=1 Tax=Alcanivorax sp. TaxID=1872427 RepID=UPI000C470750|nr:CbiX/SirB N-terminal domain-containing protein [Alcanivorax sp.]MBQ26381.1 sirohydrochlorin cobaltochelatase [Alcanivorax sp.]|tara:strand:- start:1271 stop:1654 length:384 start_codon:yes stop_codon:yes gene_type:complete
MSKALLIMAHGSRSETANDEFRVLVDTVAESAHAAGQEYVAVLPCFLELATPSLIEAIQQLEHQPVKTVQLYPLFFNKGKHVGKDIPAQIEEARERFPDLDIELMHYFGSAVGLAPLVVQHLQEQEN